MHNLLRDPIITIGGADRPVNASLPETLAALQDNTVLDFPCLRPHQAPAWHAFLVQVAVLATEGRDVPRDAAGWQVALRALTPDWPDDEPWCLVARPDAPAFLQSAAPRADLAPYTTPIAAPDEMDPLVTARNHDLKAARMRAAAPEDWLFALLNLQTTEGVMGAGKYGVMRMNGGYGSRPFLSAMPAGAMPGARFQRDLAVLHRSRDVVFANAQAFATDREVKLLWLEPWNGTQSLATGDLHPLAIEICRRVRLELAPDGGLRACGTGTAAARVAAKLLKGVTGDPWAPVETGGKDGPKVLSVSADGFGWRRMRDLLIPGVGEERTYEKPLLARPAPEDGGDVEIVANALARGQGKTEGFHTRRVRIGNAPALRALAEDGAERRRLAELARTLSNAAMIAASRCLRPALFMLFQRGPAKAQLDRTATAAQIEPWTQRFDHSVDRGFFEVLWPGAASDSARAASEVDWLRRLHRDAERVFDRAAEAAPATDQRRIFAQQRARDLLRAALHRHLPLPQPETQPETADAG